MAYTISKNGTPPIINMQEAKTHLSAIVEEVKRLGKPVIIAKAGKPQVQILPIEQIIPKRQMRMLKGQISVPDDFDSVLNDKVERAFSGDVHS